ncbi:hypothetical protein DSECCO2_661020 [anaerobic digester metagenome]
MGAGAEILVDGHVTVHVAAFAALVAGEEQHAGVTGDDHAEGVHVQGLAHEIRQLGLLVGVGLKDVPDTKPFDELPHRDGVGRLVEVAPGPGVVLVPGHGRGAVLHEHQGQVVPVEERVDDARQPGVVEGRVAQEGHDLARVVEEGQARTHARGRAHAQEHFPHAVRLHEAQGVAADVGHGDGPFGQGLLYGVEGAAMAAARTHLGRACGHGGRGLGRRPAGRDHVGPGAVQDVPDLIRRVLADPVLVVGLADDPGGQPPAVSQGLDVLLQGVVQLLQHLDLGVALQKIGDDARRHGVRHGQLEHVGPVGQPFQDIGHGQGDHARKDDATRAPVARDRVQAAFVHPALGLAEVLQGSALLGEDGGREGDVRAVGRVEARVVLKGLRLPAGEGDLLLGMADVGRQAQDDRAAQAAGQSRGLLVVGIDLGRVGRLQERRVAHGRVVAVVLLVLGRVGAWVVAQDHDHAADKVQER